MFVKLYRLGLLLVTIAISGCADRTLNYLENAQTDSEQYTMRLANEYLILASSKSSSCHTGARAQYFAKKGLVAAQGGVVAPERPRDWSIPEKLKPELADGYNKLVKTITSGVAAIAPREVAKAQTSFDCWVEGLSHHSKSDEANKCKLSFYQYMEQTDATYSKYQTKRQLLPTSPYAVYYGLGKADVPLKAHKIIAQLVQIIQQQEDYRVTVDGHADKTGSKLRNLQLSEMRAINVKNAIVSNGVPGEKIRTFAYGASNAKGKNKKPNANDRRVDITLFVPEEFLINMGDRAASLKQKQ